MIGILGELYLGELKYNATDAEIFESLEQRKNRSILCRGLADSKDDASFKSYISKQVLEVIAL